MMHRRWYLVFMALCLWYSVYCLVNANKYMEFRDVPVEVKQIYSGVGTGKHPRMEFIAIYQTQDGTIFDRNISAAAFYQLKPGDKETINIRQYDIKQNWKDNAIWFFGALAYYIIATAAGIVLLVLAFWPDTRKSNENG